MFGGPLTKLLLSAKQDPSIKLDVRLTGKNRADAPSVGEMVTVNYDPADAVLIPE